MSQIVLDVMAIGKGHEQKKYNSQSKRSLRNMVDYILDKIQDGFTLYGAKKGEQLVKLFDSNKTFSRDEIEQELIAKDSFIMKSGVKMLLAAPVMGG